METPEEEIIDPITLVLDNPLILNLIFSHLHPSYLTTCRLVNKSWYQIATSVIQKCLRTRLLLCADHNCTANLRKFINAFQNGSTIPYSRATLILDHLPFAGRKNPSAGELELRRQLAELFSSYKPRPSQHCSRFHSDGHGHCSLFRDVPPKGKNGETVKVACDLISSSIDSLIINLTLHQSPTNIEYWLQHLSFPNLTKVVFHITRPSPDDLSLKSCLTFFNAMPNLKDLNIRKLARKGDRLFTTILMALSKKTHLCKLKNLSIEVLADDKIHLEILTQSFLHLEQLSLIYLGGEVLFVQKMDAIKRFLNSLSETLVHLYTHLPLFTVDQKNFPKLPHLRTLKIEKVCREFSPSQSELFSFDFHRYFPKIKKITFKDYDLWKHMQLKSFPLEEVKPCPEIKDISLPDLCFDAPLMERYLRKFPNLKKLSIVVSFVSSYQRQSSFCLVYAFLPQLKELHMSLLEVDVSTCDTIFTGLSEETCKELVRENREPEANERELSILMLEELETLKITSVHEKRVLGITDYSVIFGFLQMPSLRRITLGSCLISPKAMLQLKEKMDVTIISNISTQINMANRVPATVPDYCDKSTNTIE